MSKQSYWFSHDYNASSDPKMVKLKRSMGHEGIGIYWEIVELLYSEGGKLFINSFDDYAFTMHTTVDKLSKVVSNFDLFKNDSIVFWSDSVNKRLALREEKSEKAKRAVNKRWKNTNVLPPQNEPNTIKEKKRKEKKFIAPSAKEVIAYFCENGYSEDAGQKAYNYYEASNWVDSQGKDVKNWKQKMQGNWFKPENKKTSNFVM